jgi:hypothetical protein
LPTIFDPAATAALHARINTLVHDRKGAWGRMSVRQMIAHLSAALENSLSDDPFAAPAGPLSRFPMNWMAIHVLPWPKGKAQAPPEFLRRPVGEWEGDVEALRALLNAAASRGPEGRWHDSPSFGHISGKSWGVLLWKHIDHHLRQFGA